jgi:hypothetical protein
MLLPTALVVAVGLVPRAGRAVTANVDVSTAARAHDAAVPEAIVPLEDANALVSPARSEDVLWHRLVVLGAEGRLMPGVIDALRTLRDSGAHSRETTLLALEPLGLAGHEGEKAVELARAFLEGRPVAWELMDVDAARRAQADELMSKGMDPDEAAWRVDNDPRRVLGAAGEPPDAAPSIDAAPTSPVAFEGEVGLPDPAPAPNATCKICPLFDASLTPAALYHTVAGVLLTGDCKVYRMTVTGGRSYRATFCEGGGSASFDTLLEARNGTCSVIASNADSCAGGRSQMDFSASANGYVYIKVSSQGGAGGSFVLAYRETGVSQAGCTQCPSSDFGPLVPTAAWQTHSASLTVGSCKMYKFSLKPARSYIFTFCQGGGAASFDTRLETFFNNCVAGPSNDDSCSGGLSEVIVNSNTSQYFYVRVSGTVVGLGNYTLAYRENVSACKTCPDFDFGPFTPTSSEQLHAAAVVGFGCRVYQFFLSAGAQYRFSLCTNAAAVPPPPTNGSAAFDSQLELLGPACASIATNDNTCGDDAQIIATATTTGIHYLRLVTAGASGNYVLSYVALTGGGSCKVCPSFDAALALPTQVYQMQPGSLAVAGDCRVYKVTLTVDKLYEFTLCPPNGSAAFDSTLKLQNSACTNVGTVNNSACGDDASGTLLAGASGNYFVTVGGAVGATGAFTLAYREVPPQCTACPAFDAALAAPLTSYQTVAGSLAQVADCRRYRVNLTAGRTYELTFCAGGGSAAFDSNVAVSDACVVIGNLQPNACGDDARTTVLAPTTGPYTVAVSSSAGIGSFVLAYREIPIVCPTCPSFTSAPTPPTTVYQTVSGTLDVAGDCRVYRFPLIANKMYEFTFCNGGGSATFDSVLSAQNPGCFSLGTPSNNQCGDDAELFLLPPTSGNHYIRVQDAGTGTGAFTLAYRQVPPVCHACPVSDVSLAAPTTSYVPVTSALIVPGDCKVFDVPLTAGDTYEFTFCSAGADGTAFDTVLSATGAGPTCRSVGVPEVNACGDDDRLVFVATATETHYITVGAVGGGVGPFTFEYRQIPVTCFNCDPPTGALPDPTTSYQIQSGTLDAAGDCRLYSVTLVAGKAYEFTFCNGTAQANDFDSVLTILDDTCDIEVGTSVDDACGDDAEATIVAASDGTYYVRVEANNNGIGDFDLAYREIPVTCPTCPSFDQVLAAPTTSYQSVFDALLTPADCRIYRVPLVAGGTYEVTFCAGQPAAPFDTVLDLLDSSCASVGSVTQDACNGDDAAASLVATVTGNYYVRVSSAAGAGAFELKYRRIPVTCLSCPASDDTLTPPTIPCQTATGSLVAAGDCRVFEVALEAGKGYELTFCPIVEPPASNCCVANGGLGCDDGACETSVCSSDSFCCSVAWDATCATEAQSLCGACSVGGCSASAAFDSVLSLTDASCNPVGFPIDDDCGDDASLTVLAASTENHYLTVSANALGTGDFELAYRELTSTCTLCPDSDAALAPPTTTYQTKVGTIVQPGDCRNYVVDLEAGKTYEFTFCDGGGSAAFNSGLDLTGSGCFGVATPENDACGDDARILYVATSTESHYIRVFTEDASTGVFTLAYREVAPQCNTCPAFDATLADPTTSYQTKSDALVAGTDCRTYRVPLVAGTTYELTFCSGGGFADFDSALELLDSGCGTVGTVNNDECPDDARATLVAGATDFYFVTVSSEGGDTGLFALAYREIPVDCPTCPAFNEGLFAPTPTYQTISDSLDTPDDCRIYQAPLTACEVYAFTFCAGGGEAVDFDSVIELFDSSCNPVGSSTDDACGDDALATLTALTTGDYYVKVSANSGGFGAFTLAYESVSPLCLTCPSYDDTLPAPTTTYQTYSDSLDGSGECRMFEVDLVAGFPYEFTFCNGGGSAAFDSVLELLNPSCLSVGTAIDDDCGDDASLTYSGTLTQPYYVRVSANSCETGNFTLAYRQVP